MIRSLFTLAILLLCLPSFSQGPRGDVYFKQAKEVLDGGDSDKAIKVFLNARKEYLKEILPDRLGAVMRQFHVKGIVSYIISVAPTSIFMVGFTFINSMAFSNSTLL